MNDMDNDVNDKRIKYKCGERNPCVYCPSWCPECDAAQALSWASATPVAKNIYPVHCMSCHETYYQYIPVHKCDGSPLGEGNTTDCCDAYAKQEAERMGIIYVPE